MPLRPLRRTHAVAGLIALAVVVAVYACSPNFRPASGPAAGPFAGDFLQEWLGGWIVRAGDHARFYDPAYAYARQHDPSLVGYQWNEDEYLPIVYPPFYYLLISPLSLAPLHAAAWVWAALMTAALVGWAWLTAAWLGERNANTPTPSGAWSRIGTAGWLLLAAVWFAPLIESLSSSQKGTVCLLLLTATFILWDRGRPLAAGVVFGLIAFKPQLALVIPLVALCRGQWRF
ncbi:MAG: DUF2029 domain-containing protein, partial [Planctomycetales bacterium]|nr:DUF2029 domain-containing protein [Planctomycetales bacterium]